MKIFNGIERTAYLTKRYYQENSLHEVVLWAVVTYLFTILDHRIFVIMILFGSGIYQSLYLQKYLLRGSGASTFIMLPASVSEKIFSVILINTFIHFIMIVVSYCIGNLLVYFIYHLIVKIDVPVNWDLFIYNKSILLGGALHIYTRNVFISLFGYFALIQAILLCGILYFRNYALLITACVLCLIFLFLSTIQYALFKTLWDIKHLSNVILPVIFMIQNDRFPPIVNYLINAGTYAFLPLLWITCIFRLKENEYE